MPQATLRVRVERLELAVEPLRTLPERIDRLERTVAAGDAALRDEMQGGLAALREEIKAGDARLDGKIDVLATEVRQIRLDMGEMHAQILGTIDTKTDEAKRHATVLYEDLKNLIKTIRHG